MLGRIATQVACALVILARVGSGAAHSEADGPDFWSVKAVASGDVLNMRSAPSATASKIGAIPHDARGLKNLGCQGGPTFDQWSKMTPHERKEAAKKRWCQVEYDGKRGWVAGRFLGE
jgi:uncharacterized protein YraI